MGVGARLVRRVVLRDVARTEPAKGPRTDRCAWCAAAAGSSPTCGCSRAATVTRFLRTPTRTPSGSAWPRLEGKQQRIDHVQSCMCPCRNGVAGGGACCRTGASPARDSVRTRRDHHRRGLGAESARPCVGDDRGRDARTHGARGAARQHRGHDRGDGEDQGVRHPLGRDADDRLHPPAGIRLRERSPDLARVRRAQSAAGAGRYAREARRDHRRGGVGGRDQRQQHPVRSAGSRHRRARGTAPGGCRRARARRRGCRGCWPESGSRAADRGTARLGCCPRVSRSRCMRRAAKP